MHNYLGRPVVRVDSRADAPSAVALAAGEAVLRRVPMLLVGARPWSWSAGARTVDRARLD